LITQMYVAGEAQNERDGILNGIRDARQRDSVIISLQPGDSLEEQARRARRALLRQAARECQARVVWLAQHADDRHVGGCGGGDHFRQSPQRRHVAGRGQQYAMGRLAQAYVRNGRRRGAQTELEETTSDQSMGFGFVQIAAAPPQFECER
jgi:hypothetical protein